MTNNAGKIVAFTERVARELAASCAGDPVAELRLWIRIAQTREAMVCQLYGLDAIDKRVGPCLRRSVPEVARLAIRNIWVHEESHARYLAALQRSWDIETVMLNEIYGRLQGFVTDAATRGNVLARLAIAVGVALQQAPDFVNELERMTLRDFCSFVGELENTAILGYRRMLELATTMPIDLATSAGLPYSFRTDVARICAEESFHAGAFEIISGWLAPNGETFLDLSANACVLRLHRAVDSLLGSSSKRSRDPHATREPDPEVVWISDGGMAQLFADYGLPLRLP